MWLLTWQMRWLNRSATKINDTLQLLDIYRYILACNLGKRMAFKIKYNFYYKNTNN